MNFWRTLFALFIAASLTACGGGGGSDPPPAPTTPVITAQPLALSTSYGKSATFSVSATSASTQSYQWQRDGNPIDGALEASYTLPIAVPGDSGASFSVVVTNSQGSTQSAAARLTVIDIPVAGPVRWAAGSSHTTFVRGDGTVLSWGNIQADIGTSLSGLMGVGLDAVVPGTPTSAKLSSGAPFTGAQAIAAGQWSTLVLKTDGTVWGWGYAGWGNLGTGAFAFEQRSPVQVKKTDGSALTGVVQMSAGIYSTSMAVASDGAVWGWGQNRYGQLGLGSSSETGQYAAAPMLSPSGLGRFTDAVQVAAGISHALALKRDGSVYAVGWGDFGALGDGSTSIRTSLPVRVDLAPGVPLANVVGIAAGGNFSVVVLGDGTAYAWGTNSFGQLGNGARTQQNRPVRVRDASGRPMSGIVNVAAGNDFTMFLKADSTVWAVGNNSVGQLGTNSSAAFSAVPEVVKDTSGNVFGSVVGVYLTAGHTMVRRADGSLWVWGFNTFLQVGDLTSVTRRFPVRVQ